MVLVFQGTGIRSKTLYTLIMLVIAGITYAWPARETISRAISPVVSSTC